VCYVNNRARRYIVALYAPRATNAPAKTPIASRCDIARRGSRYISHATIAAPSAHADVPKTRQLRQSLWGARAALAASPRRARAPSGAYERCENGVFIAARDGRRSSPEASTTIDRELKTLARWKRLDDDETTNPLLL
jgi:hypothetical protein